MRRTNGWVNTLFALVFIAGPAMMGFYFLLPDWNQNHQLAIWIYYLIALGFIVYVCLLSWILIFFQILGVDALNFNIPITLSFIVIFVSYNWPITLRIIGTFLAVICAFPVTAMTHRYIDHKLSLAKKNAQKRKH